MKIYFIPTYRVLLIKSYNFEVRFFFFLHVTCLQSLRLGLIRKLNIVALTFVNKARIESMYTYI